MKIMKRLSFCVWLIGLFTLTSVPLGFCRSQAGTEVEYRLAGNHYLLQGNPKLAIEEYQKAITLNSHSTALYFNLAIALYTVGKIDAAAQALDKLLTLDPQDVEAQYNLACLRFYQQDTVKAEEHFEKAKLCCPSDPRFAPLINKGLEFLKELKDTDPSAQSVLFFLLQQGLPPIMLTTVGS